MIDVLERVAAVLVVMGGGVFLIGLFLDRLDHLVRLVEDVGDDSGCSGHHPEVTKHLKKWRIKEVWYGGGVKLNLEKRVRVACRHEGCDFQESRWRTVDEFENLSSLEGHLVDKVDPEVIDA